MEGVKARHQTVQGNACRGGLQSRERFGACVAVHVTRAVWSRHGGRSLPGNLCRERERGLSSFLWPGWHPGGKNTQWFISPYSWKSRGPKGGSPTTYFAANHMGWRAKRGLYRNHYFPHVCRLWGGKSSVPRGGWRETEVVNTWQLFKNQKYSIK